MSILEMTHAQLLKADRETLFGYLERTARWPSSIDFNQGLRELRAECLTEWRRVCTGDWVPCSRELPPRATSVLVTLQGGRSHSKPEVSIATYWTQGHGHDAPDPGWCDINGDDLMISHVVAWRFEPEPWGAGK